MPSRSVATPWPTPLARAVTYRSPFRVRRAGVTPTMGAGIPFALCTRHPGPRYRTHQSPKIFWDAPVTLAHFTDRPTAAAIRFCALRQGLPRQALDVQSGWHPKRVHHLNPATLTPPGACEICAATCAFRRRRAFLPAPIRTMIRSRRHADGGS